MRFSNKTANIAAAVLLGGAMLSTAVFSMKKDSLTFDELAHIPAGYSYLTKQDYRLNPEHPPLIKDIPALPLLFLNLNFPDNHPAWTQEESAPAWWAQFDLGREFIYRSGNDPREIIFWSRFAMIGLMIILGWLVFAWTRRLTNNTVALGVLALFCFSPTFLGHGRLVNTDLGAVFGTVAAIACWLSFLQKPSWKRTVLAGLAFGLAMLLKFSLILLIPFFAIITVLYALLFSLSIFPYLKKSLAAGIVGFMFVIWPVYQFHVWNYPAEQQLRDTAADISSHPIAFAKDITIWMAEQKPLRAPAQYFRGVLMASQRTVWGNTTYYLGEISTSGWWHYFPVLYFLKVPLTLHILTLFALSALFASFRRQKLLSIMRQHFWAAVFVLWIAVYWTAAILGNLNIGIRHLLPIFPFIYILVVFGAYGFLKQVKPNLRRITTAFFLLMLLWYISSSLSAFPHYLSYYNELAGGTEEGYKIAVDSNYDWGQDFYRLLAFVEKEKIEKIHLDYFGGEDTEYWLGEKYVKLNPKEMKESPKGWVAVSLNQLMGGIAKPAKDFDQETGYYNWLKEYTPVSRAGYSIPIYRID